MNGLYVVRPSQVEVDTWASLVEGGDQWSWDAMFAAMKASEAFSPPTSTVQNTADIVFNAASHGTAGNLHVSYPGL